MAVRMSDPERKTPAPPMRETLRPRVRAETADLPARVSDSGAPSEEDDIKTEALNLEDIEDLGSLLEKGTE